MSLWGNSTIHVVKKQAEKGFKSSLQKQTFLKKVFNAASDDDIKDSLSDASKFFFQRFLLWLPKKSRYMQFGMQYWFRQQKCRLNYIGFNFSSESLFSPIVKKKLVMQFQKHLHFHAGFLGYYGKICKFPRSEWVLCILKKISKFSFRYARSTTYVTKCEQEALHNMQSKQYAKAAKAVLVVIIINIASPLRASN